MSRIELMATVALAAGLSFTIAEIASTDSDGRSESARRIGLSDYEGLGGLGDKAEPLQGFGGDLRDAYW